MLTSVGAVTHYGLTAVGRSGETIGPAVAALAGIALVGLAAGSLAIHWVGALLLGGVHALLGLLALVAPFGNPFAGGIFSPVFQITRMLGTFDRVLSEEAAVFFFSGTALIVGAFLSAAALGIRSRRVSGWSTRRAVALSSTVGAAALTVAVALHLVAGGHLSVSVLQFMRYDAGFAALTVVAGVFAGLAGLLLRWSSLGVFIVSGIVLIAGIATFLLPVPPQFEGRLITGYGMLAVAGATFVGAALGGLARSADEVTEDPEPL